MENTSENLVKYRPLPIRAASLVNGWVQASRAPREDSSPFRHSPREAASEHKKHVSMLACVPFTVPCSETSWKNPSHVVFLLSSL